ncbi:HPF/RaiA family ribosome-associated protein [Thermaurantiacus tibetensis]|uniref:HPF/RaiA family ribosome-associated protein n=1 Tax=Thermaurantiacus tibetensis TaxID=2759035 RepID=UPI00188E0917|nr:HPF/RaiA family ribosome-associated protein [Thermaurantiacus tibetensis]
MEFLFYTSNQITGDDDVRARIEAAVREKLERIAPALTRVELHLSDPDGRARDAAGKRARLEARPKGRDPIVVSHDAPTVDLAAVGAAEKLLVAFAREQGRITSRKGH